MIDYSRAGAVIVDRQAKTAKQKESNKSVTIPLWIHSRSYWISRVMKSTSPTHLRTLSLALPPWRVCLPLATRLMPKHLNRSFQPRLPSSQPFPRMAT